MLQGDLPHIKSYVLEFDVTKLHWLNERFEVEEVRDIVWSSLAQRLQLFPNSTHGGLSFVAAAAVVCFPCLFSGKG